MEYIGALSDLTGELGRIAVFKAIRRDAECINAVLAVDTAVAQALVQVNINGLVGKKLDAVLANRRKVAELRYDMVCLSLSGGVRSSTIGNGNEDGGVPGDRDRDRGGKGKEEKEDD